MEFEAVLLDGAQRERQNQLWIHAKIKACVRQEDCVAVSSTKVVPRLGELYFCSCLSLLIILACSSHATWGPPFNRALYVLVFVDISAHPHLHFALAVARALGRPPQAVSQFAELSRCRQRHRHPRSLARYRACIF